MAAPRGGVRARRWSSTATARSARRTSSPRRSSSAPIGETTDVVEKEMYSFAHHDEPLTLRPEGTAGAARAYVEHSVHNSEPVTRWYYLGPMFRGERPQRGPLPPVLPGRRGDLRRRGPRLRRGDDRRCSSASSASIGITDAEVLVNSLGGAETRAKYREALVAYLDAAEGQAERRLAAPPRRRTRSASSTRRTRATRRPSRARPRSSSSSTTRTARTWTSLPPPPRRARHAVHGRPEARARPRLLHAHALRDQRRYGKLGAGEHARRRRPLRRHGRDLGGPDVPAIGFAAGPRAPAHRERRSRPPARVVDVLRRAASATRAVDAALVLGARAAARRASLRGRHARRRR